MSDYQQFLNERDKIDFLIENGYLITGVREDLNGATIDFSQMNDNKKETLHVTTANARKYFSSILIQQNAAID